MKCATCKMKSEHVWRMRALLERFARIHPRAIVAYLPHDVERVHDDAQQLLIDIQIDESREAAR